MSQSIRGRIPGLLILGGLGAMAYAIEAARQTWSAVHLERTLTSTAAIAASCPAGRV